jgi:hypothetical protein
MSRQKLEQGKITTITQVDGILDVILTDEEFEVYRDFIERAIFTQYNLPRIDLDLVLVIPRRSFKRYRTFRLEV